MEELNQFKNKLNKLLYFLAGNIFRSFLIVLFLSLVIGGFMFYKCGFSEKEIDPALIGEVVQFKENLYQKVLAEWNERQKTFEEAESKTYVNPFE